jgi:hypothetical protein
MNATRKAELERLALAVRRARAETREETEEDRLIAAGWGDVDGLSIPSHVRELARTGGAVPPYCEKPSKKTGPKDEPARKVAPSRWFAPGEKPKVLNRRKAD